MPNVELFCNRREADLTVAALLKNRLGLSWARVKKLIEGRHITIGGQVEANPARRVRPGLRVVVAGNVVEQREPKEKVPPSRPAKPKTVKTPDRGWPPKRPAPTNPKRPASRPTTHDPRPPDFEPEIVYADPDVVVVNKPAGLTTMRHAEEAAEFGKGKRYLPKTLADLLPRLLNEPGCRILAVHRIDRDTSGLVVFARTAAAEKKLTEQFRKHTAERKYLALVRGKPKSGRIESTIAPDRGDGRRGSGEHADAKSAVTHVKVVEPLGPFAAVECRLETGRTHQVRIHLGEAGTPLCGEKVYDRPVNGKPFPDGSGAKRPMLHAAKLGFTHPVSGERLTWDVPPPADFAALWAELRAAAKA